MTGKPLIQFGIRVAILIQFLSGPIVIAQSPKSELRSSKKTNSIPVNFKTENLVTWCIVPFDAKNRGPAERAQMVRRLGLKRVAYDWRNKHIPEFEQEILEYQKNGIEYFAFWGWHDSMEALINRHRIKPQIWEMYRGQLIEGTDAEKVADVVRQLLPLAKKAKSLGLQFGVYNHGGWAGEPVNMVAVCKFLREKHGLDNVGIVYNFHHGHGDVDEFEEKFKLLKPYLICLNLNGMADPKTVDRNTHANQILPIGSGLNEKNMIQVVIDSGYEGPVGILGHRADMDAEKSVGLNVQGLRKLVEGM